jgi:UDP:flavonoid glycosyltransferase YjiC (YdhE family)
MRILFTSNPLVGHWLPMLPLARAAEAAGHEVVIAAGPDVVADIDRRGLTAWSIGPDLATIEAGVRDRPRAASESDATRTVADGLAMFAAPAIDRARGLVVLTASWLPDIVIQEIYELAGAYVPARLHVLHGLGAHYPGFVGLRELALGYVGSTLGPPAWRAPVADTLYVDPFPPILQSPGDRPFNDVLGVRPDAGEVGPDEVLPQSVGQLPHERTVYLTLGTVFNTVEQFSLPLAALQELPVNVVLTCGYGVDKTAFGQLPPNVVVEQYLPQALLLPTCSVVVCHAGAGTVIGALAHGVPLVCLPRGADQFGNAEQVSRTGAGISLRPEEVSAESIRDACRRVLEDASYAAAASALQDEIELLPDPSTVVKELVRRAA